MARKKNYEALLKKAQTAGIKRDYKKALAYLKQIISETDMYPEAYLYMGRALHALGEYGKAVPYYKVFIQHFPKSSSGYFFLARTFIAAEVPRKAVRPLRIAMKISPDNPMHHMYLGLTAVRLRRLDIALEHLGIAVDLDPENKTLYTGYLNILLVQSIRKFYYGDFQTAEQMLEFYSRIMPDEILPYLYLGIIKRDKGDYAAALDNYLKANEISPKDKLIQFQCAVLYHRLGEQVNARKYDKSLKNYIPEFSTFSWQPYVTNKFIAIELYRKQEYRKAIYFAIQVLKEHPEYDMHMLMAESHRALNDLRKAENHLHRALDICKSKKEPYYGLIMIHWQNEQYEEVAKDISHLHRISPYDEIGDYYKAICYPKLHFNPEKTIPLLIDQIKKNDNDPTLLSTIASEYLRANNHNLAIKWFEKTFELDQENEVALSSLLFLYKQSGNNQKIKTSYERYTAAYPYRSDIIEEYIEFLYEAEDLEAVIDQITHLNAVSKNTEKNIRLLAYCYRELGQFREASIYYRQLLQKNPSSELFLQSLIYCIDKDDRPLEAIDLLEKATTFISPSGNLLLIYGTLLAKAEKTSKALKIFRQVITISPKDWRGYHNIGVMYEKKGMKSMADRFYAQSKKKKKELNAKYVHS